MKRCIGPITFISCLQTTILSWSKLDPVPQCCFSSPTIWGWDCSYCPMKVISHPPLFHCSSVLQLSTGLLTAPNMAGHGGHGAMLVAHRAQQNLSSELHWNNGGWESPSWWWWWYNNNNNNINNNIRNHNHTKLSIVEHQQQQREYVSHHHPIIQHTHEHI